MELFDKFELDVGELSYAGRFLADENKQKKYIGSKETPIHIHTDSDTDWATVSPSIAGVVVALIVAWLTVRVQKNQIKANISNFRHQWMAELRACASEYLQVLYAVALRRESVRGYVNEKGYLEDQERIAILSCKLEMLLSRDDERTKKIFALDIELIEDIYALRFGESKAEIIDKLNVLKNILRQELEGAWGDIQIDVGKKTCK